MISGRSLQFRWNVYKTRNLVRNLVQPMPEIERRAARIAVKSIHKSHINSLTWKRERQVTRAKHTRCDGNPMWPGKFPH